MDVENHINAETGTEHQLLTYERSVYTSNYALAIKKKGIGLCRAVPQLFLIKWFLIVTVYTKSKLVLSDDRNSKKMWKRKHNKSV